MYVYNTPVVSSMALCISATQTGKGYEVGNRWDVVGWISEKLGETVSPYCEVDTCS